MEMSANLNFHTKTIKTSRQVTHYTLVRNHESFPPGGCCCARIVFLGPLFSSHGIPTLVFALTSKKDTVKFALAFSTECSAQYLLNTKGS